MESRHSEVQRKLFLYISANALRKVQTPLDSIVIGFAALKTTTKIHLEPQWTERLQWPKVPFMHIYLADGS